MRSSPRTVPLLPCGSIDEAAEFGTAIGFEVSYRQGPPNPYLALLSPGGIELHYFEVRDFDPATSHGSCLVIVANPVKVLATWSAGLDRLYGTVPVQGIPRLLRPTAQTSADAFLGFSLVDVGGNRIRVVKDVHHADPIDDDLMIQPIGVVVTPSAPIPSDPEVVPDPEPDPDPGPEPGPADEPDIGAVFGDDEEPMATLGPRPSAFERHGVAAAPQHRLSALVYLADLAVRLHRFDDARVHLEAAETIDASAPSVISLRESLLEAGVQLDDRLGS